MSSQVEAWRQRLPDFATKMDACLTEAASERQKWLQKTAQINSNLPSGAEEEKSAQSELASERSALLAVLQREVSLLSETVS